AVLLADAEVRAEEVPYGEERNVPAVGHAVCRVDLELARPTARQELEAEAALPDPCLCHDAHDPSVAAVECRLEGAHLVLPADEAGEATRARHVEAGAEGADAQQGEDPDRRLRPLDRERTQVLQLEEAGEELRRVLGQVDLARLRQLLHALREP